ncbi:MAG: hypothetical protein ACREQJ_17340, partial [Candidatus Binatia bacterium]
MKRTMWIALGLVIVSALAVFAASSGYKRLTATSEYFAQRENQKVTPDVAAQVKWLFFEDFEAPLYQPGAHFEPWKGIPDRFIRY